MENEFNLQEAFNKAADAVIAQGEPSISPDPGSAFCMYRGPRGLKCAIGHLIPDDAYDEGFERLLTREVVTEVFGDMDPATTRALCRLQAAHDEAGTRAKWGEGPFVPEFKRSVRQVCDEFNLEVPASCREENDNE